MLSVFHRFGRQASHQIVRRPCSAKNNQRDSLSANLDIDSGLLVERRHNKNNNMTRRPCGAVLTVFGTKSADLNCSCHNHSICGSQLRHDTLVRFEKRAVEVGKSIFLVVDNITKNSPLHSILQKPTNTRLLALCASFRTASISVPSGI